MTRWIEIGALDQIPRLGARVVRTASGKLIKGIVQGPGVVEIR